MKSRPWGCAVELRYRHHVCSQSALQFEAGPCQNTLTASITPSFHHLSAPGGSTEREAACKRRDSAWHAARGMGAQAGRKSAGGLKAETARAGFHDQPSFRAVALPVLPGGTQYPERGPSREASEDRQGEGQDRKPPGSQRCRLLQRGTQTAEAAINDQVLGGADGTG